MIDDKLAMRRWRERIESLLAIALARGNGGGSGGNFAFAVINANNVDAAVTTQSTFVSFTNLSANRTAVLPPAPITGQAVIVKDGDGSLGLHDIIINGNGKAIDGAATYTMTAAVDGVKGSISMIYNGTSWGIT